MADHLSNREIVVTDRSQLFELSGPCGPSWAFVAMLALMLSDIDAVELFGDRFLDFL